MMKTLSITTVEKCVENTENKLYSYISRQVSTLENIGPHVEESTDSELYLFNAIDHGVPQSLFSKWYSLKCEAKFADGDCVDWSKDDIDKFNELVAIHIFGSKGLLKEFESYLALK